MISAWWLFLIVPVSALAGIIVSSMLSSSARADECANCQYNKYKEKSE